MRKACVNWFGLIVYLVFLICYLTIILAWYYELIGYYETLKIYQTIYFVIVIIFIATMTFSLYRIHNYTKMLVANKVFANEKLMIIHLSCFAMLALTLIIEYSIDFSLRQTEFKNYDENQLRRAYVKQILYFISSISYGLAYITMITMFLK